jgi:hypothetical protein
MKLFESYQWKMNQQDATLCVAKERRFVTTVDEKIIELANFGAEIPLDPHSGERVIR